MPEAQRSGRQARERRRGQTSLPAAPLQHAAILSALQASKVLSLLTLAHLPRTQLIPGVCRRLRQHLASNLICPEWRAGRRFPGSFTALIFIPRASFSWLRYVNGRLWPLTAPASARAPTGRAAGCVSGCRCCHRGSPMQCCRGTLHSSQSSTRTEWPWLVSCNGGMSATSPLAQQRRDTGGTPAHPQLQAFPPLPFSDS